MPILTRFTLEKETETSNTDELLTTLQATLASLQEQLALKTKQVQAEHKALTDILKESLKRLDGPGYPPAQQTPVTSSTATVKQRIVDLLKSAPAPVHYLEIATILNVPSSKIAATLSSLCRARPTPLVKRVKAGFYTAI